MFFQPLHRVIGSLEHQEGWQKRRQFQQLAACWAEIVGPAVAAQTQPLGIQREVLQVATSSSAWAQNLMFERQRILAKLNTRLNSSLTDIRFSTAQWQPAAPGSSQSRDEALAEQWRSHPSHLSTTHSGTPASPEASPAAQPADPNQAFQQWASSIQAQFSHLPLCPKCQAPTPPGEIERWKVCALCAAKSW